MADRLQWLRMLRVRIVLWTVALEAVLLIVFAVLLVSIIQNTQNQQINETLRLSAAQMNAVVDVRGTAFDVPAQDVADIVSRGVMVWILAPDGSLGATVGQADRYPLPNLIPSDDSTSDVELMPGEIVRMLVEPLREGSRSLGTLILALPLKQEFQVIAFVRWGFLISIPIALILSIIGGYFLANRALVPIKEITSTAQQINATDLKKRIELNLPDDEVGQLANTFNEMLERIENAFRRERQFTSDASHELRTPLGFLKTQLSLARSKPRSVEDLLAMMAEMETDVDRMTQLIEQMLILARLENQELPQKETINLSDMIASITDEYETTVQQQGKKLILSRPFTIDFTIMGIPTLLHQVVVNLLENALKYTDENDTIRIDLRRQWQDIIISIEDSGQGIPPEDLPHLFSRFYRVDSARTRESGGFGLGLAITKAIVEAHGGRIEVTSAIGQGTTFLIYFQ